MTDTTDDAAADRLRGRVADNYGAIARDVMETGSGGCCDPTPAPADEAGCCDSTAAVPERDDPITRDLYSDDETASLPADASAASLGCGNPTALAELHEGETVLDLGSGGGIDVLLSARRVGSTGKAYGLDMTDDMLELARRNQREAGVENVEFLKGRIEDVPLPDASVDLIISNCVVNLSPDKPTVFAEAFRVLRPGGRFAISDIVVRGELDPEVRRSVESWIGCVAGALEEQEYRSLLEQAGFDDVEIVPTREYGVDDVRDLAEAAGIDPQRAAAAGGRVISAFVRATRPTGG
jgi:SAM-dependent methyltransferase